MQHKVIKPKKVLYLDDILKADKITRCRMFKEIVQGKAKYVENRKNNEKTGGSLC